MKRAPNATALAIDGDGDMWAEYEGSFECLTKSVMTATITDLRADFGPITVYSPTGLAVDHQAQAERLLSDQGGGDTSLMPQLARAGVHALLAVSCALRART